MISPLIETNVSGLLNIARYFFCSFSVRLPKYSVLQLQITAVPAMMSYTFPFSSNKALFKGSPVILPLHAKGHQQTSLYLICQVSPYVTPLFLHLFILELVTYNITFHYSNQVFSPYQNTYLT